MLLQAILRLQGNQPDPVFVHRRDASGQQGKAHARADHAQQGEDIVHLHGHLRFEAGLLEHPRAIAVGGEALGQGDEGGVGQVGQVHLGLLGERRVGGDGEEDVVGEQRQLLAGRVADAFVERHQDGLQLVVLQALQQVDVGAQGQVDVQFTAAQLQAHHQLGHGFYRQRVERAQAEALGIEAGGLTGLAHHLLGVLDQLAGFLFQHVGAFQRDQLAAFVLEQRAAQGAFQRVDGAVHADGAGGQLGGGAAEVAAAHEGEEGFQLLEGQFFVDEHGMAWGRAMAGSCMLFWNSGAASQPIAGKPPQVLHMV
ncbi:hypothetical protein TZ03_12150 [Pseudomonas sp. 10-1B]|nr:hypothetical protein TZ03_12150 [Pseudomonas sp. 10-1B]